MSSELNTNKTSTESNSFFVPSNIEEVLTAYYQSVNPEKVASVKTILESNKGNEERLYQRLLNKYGKEPWSLSPAQPTSLTADQCARLNALRNNIYSR